MKWIVDVISCVVSVKNNPIKDGKLYHQDVRKIWASYDESLHDWMLRLTEEFDLTFPVAEQEMKIVPCLLPDKEPEMNWNQGDDNASSKIKEFKVVYSFRYLPAGLFNRIQVRLFQYGDGFVIWKNGSLLNKNKHLALLTQTEMSMIEVRVKGIKPENIVFLIHEVIETLIQESFNGIQYDYSFPCPECVDAKSPDPCLFNSSFLRRAQEYKAPFLQCNKFFHAISIEEMLAFMPLNSSSSSSSIDLNLEYALRDLKQIKRNFKYDLTFWYCSNDTKLDNGKSINPLKLIETLTRENYKIWYTKNPDEEKLDKLTYAIKESKMVILGISDEFSKNEKCIQVFDLVKNIIKKNYLLIEFGSINEHEWLKNPKFASICSDCRVIMQDPSRYKFKLNEVFETLERQIKTEAPAKTGNTDAEKSPNNQPPDVFISYCWANSHDAVKKGTKSTKTSLGWLDPRTLDKFFKDNGVNSWLDIQEANPSSSLFGEITSGINSASVFISCLSDEYVKSRNCELEFRFAHVSLKIPIIKAIVGTSNEWRKHELSFLSGIYPEINFQYENQSKPLREFS